MALKIRTFFLYVSISIVSFTLTYHLLLPTVSDQLRRHSTVYFPTPRLHPNYLDKYHIINDTQVIQVHASCSVHINEINHSSIIHFKPYHETVLYNETIDTQFHDVKWILEAGDNNNNKNNNNNNNNSMPVLRNDVLSVTNVSVLFPSWEALVIIPTENDVVFHNNNNNNNNNTTWLLCLFDTNEISPARFTGTMSYPDRRTYTCPLPKRVLRRLPFRQPVLIKKENDVVYSQVGLSPAPELLRWNFIVYEIFEAEDDVVLFVKGINNRQGVNRSPTEFKCLFGDNIVNGVMTSVTSSVQEVFRCQRPELTEFGQNLVRVSLVILQNKQVVPSLAYYKPRRKIATDGTKSLLCACTMVYNVAKFLKEWVIYHSKIGVNKFILYDNGSEDDLGKVVNLLKSKGFDVEVRFWLWPKTQEGGFSHAVLHAKTACKWMMFIDVDEFVYSPSWASSKPSKSLLHSLLPTDSYGQLMIRCYEFGPSNQKSHPLEGVTQGYTCRKDIENRHKSIALLDAIHESLLNVIHHFKLKDGYKTKKANLSTLVVNHYKYQAWAEFKAKFRRRVSAYVVDWTRSVNLKSNDRAPGLGSLAVEPKGWEERFCEVYDNRLKHLTRRWFGRRKGRSGLRMVWQNI